MVRGPPPLLRVPVRIFLTVVGCRVTKKTTEDIVKQLLFSTRHKIRSGELVKKNTGFNFRAYKGVVTK
jgi:hypothetical protein